MASTLSDERIARGRWRSVGVPTAVRENRASTTTPVRPNLVDVDVSRCQAVRRVIPRRGATYARVFQSLSSGTDLARAQSILME
jgi:hypothetical protein